MNKLIGKFNNMDKSIKRTIIGGIIVVVVLVVGVFIIGTLNNRKLSYSRLESKIQNAAISYYENHPEKLPNSEGGEVELDVKKLVKAGYLKELTEYNDDECSAIIFVQNNGGEYLYRTYLNCKGYSTKTLVNYITNDQGIVTSGEGLYQYGDEYIYRGENVNNYIKFSGDLWRILRINNDGSLRIIQNRTIETMIWDDRYNIDFDDYVGINNYEVSRIKDSLSEFGNNPDNIETNLKKWVVAKNVCLDKKDNVNFSDISSLNCNNYSNEKYQFTLPQLEDYFIASIDSNCNRIDSNSCTNYNYLATGRYWTLTPSAAKSNRVYVIGGSAKTAEISGVYTVRVLTNLSEHILYAEGDGSYENPFTIE